MAVDRAVGGLEAPADLVAPGGVEGPVGEGDADLVALLPVAHVGEPAEADLVGRNRLAEDGAPLGLHLGDRPRDGGPVEGVQRAGERPHEVERERRHEESHRRHDSGAQRVDHARAPEDAGHAEGVHGPGAPEGEDREALDVLAALDRVDARGARHALVGQLVDAPGRLHGAETERPPDPLGDRVPSGVPVEPHLAAEEEVGVEIPQHEVGVGHGRLRAAEAVRHRPGPRPRALGADEEPAKRVDAGDRAAAGADLDHLDHRDLDREPAALLEMIAAVDLELGETSGSPSAMTHALAVVPPMSNDRRSLWPRSAP